jgi:Uri superfamily endonuclease
MEIKNSGAYILLLETPTTISVRIGALGEARLPKGQLLYVGSARKNLMQRIDRHRRLARQKEGKLHWHIDYLLTHSRIKLVEVIPFPGGDECRISRQIAQKKGMTVPVRRFGATDCRSGCPAHLYHLKKFSRACLPNFTD